MKVLPISLIITLLFSNLALLGYPNCMEPLKKDGPPFFTAECYQQESVKAEKDKKPQNKFMALYEEHVKNKEKKK